MTFPATVSRYMDIHVGYSRDTCLRLTLCFYDVSLLHVFVTCFCVRFFMTWNNFSTEPGVDLRHESGLLVGMDDTIYISWDLVRTWRKAEETEDASDWFSYIIPVENPVESGHDDLVSISKSLWVTRMYADDYNEKYIQKVLCYWSKSYGHYPDVDCKKDVAYYLNISYKRVTTFCNNQRKRFKRVNGRYVSVCNDFRKRYSMVDGNLVIISNDTRTNETCV
jgi:hypothetical protein